MNRRSFIAGLLGTAVAAPVAADTFIKLKNGSVLTFQGTPFIFDKFVSQETPFMTQFLNTHYKEVCASLLASESDSAEVSREDALLLS